MYAGESLWSYWSDCMSFVQAGFTSLAHTDEDIDATIAAAQQVFAEI